MSKPVSIPSESFPILFARKLALFVLLVVVTALLLVILLLQVRRPIMLLAFLLTDMIAGLIAGASVRWILFKKRNRALQIFVILAFVGSSLVLLGWLTGWQFGFNPLRIGLDRLNWWAFGQILLGTFSGLLVLYARRRPALVVEKSPTPLKKIPHPKKRPQKRREVKAIPARKNPPAPSRPAAAAPAPISATARPVKPGRRNLFRRKPVLQLSAEEEHRCPYCLELVKPNDPRGVVECKICHTLHHADCWAITGTCQVPHYVT